MPVFARRAVPPEREEDYRRYRPLVREDFQECCAYCLLHELLAGGEDNYELDHFRPRANFDATDNSHDYYNLYYTCHVCNHYKGPSWPKEKLSKDGYRFVDLCCEDFRSHFDPMPSGEWIPTTPAGEYTAARIRLNRKHLVQVRALLTEIAILRGYQVDWECPSASQKRIWAHIRRSETE